MMRLISPVLKNAKILRSFNVFCKRNAPINIKMPSLSPTMVDGSIVAWAKKEGEEVCEGDVLCEVQTDKAVVALESEDNGFLAKIIVPVGTPNIKIGQPIAVLATADENWQEVAKSALPDNSISDVTQTSSVNTLKPSETEFQPSKFFSSKESEKPCCIGPAVRLLLQSYGLDKTQIPATGPHGQLLKGDVLKYMATQHAEPCTTKSKSTLKPSSTSSQFVDIPLTNMRSVIAKRLTESKSTIPHSYVQAVACLDEIIHLRKEIKQNMGLKVSVNDFVIKACALGLKIIPELNAVADAHGQMCTVMNNVDISMAVSTPTGLITPIIFSPNELSLSQISKVSTNLVQKARNGKLQPHEFQGGTFSISNLGMFGVRDFSAIINFPQVAIMAVSSGLPKPKYSDVESKIQFSNKMNLTLSIDSRFVELTKASAFLQHVTNLLHHPTFLIANDPVLNPNSHLDEFETMMVDLNSSNFDVKM